MAAPIRICCTSTQTPAADIIGMAGTGASVGVITIASSKASNSLTERGTTASLNTGAVPMSDSMRTKGQRKVTTHRFNCPELTDRMGSIRTPVAGSN